MAVDKFPHTERGIRRTFYLLVPCGDGMLSTSGEFVEVLCFRHFARYMSFAPTGKQGRKKQIMDGIEVSVVLHLV